MAIAAVVALVSFFNGRDDSTTSSSAAGPGVAAALPPGLRAVVHGGNIVIEYPTAGDGSVHALVDVAPLRRLARDVAGDPPASAALRRAGQAIELRGVGGRDQIVVYAFRRQLRTSDPADPALREFVEYWLGRGAQG